jgi:tRNA threonylcarbamoyladenosine biosynthesis protein TsaE
LYHFDFYRFKRSSEWVDSGFRDYFNQESLCIVEWPEKAAGQLPAADVTIQMSIVENGRAVMLNAESEEGRRCLEQLVS